MINANYDSLKVDFPLNNSVSTTYQQCTDILRTYTSEQMLCVEFDLQSIPIQRMFVTETNEINEHI